MIEIKTPIINEKTEQAQAEKKPELENVLKLANEKIASLETAVKLAQDGIVGKEKELAEIKKSNTPEQIVRNILQDGKRINVEVLKYLLKVDAIEREIEIGAIKLKRVYLNSSLYDLA